MAFSMETSEESATSIECDVSDRFEMQHNNKITNTLRGIDDIK